MERTFKKTYFNYFLNFINNGYHQSAGKPLLRPRMGLVADYSALWCCVWASGPLLLPREEGLPEPEIKSALRKYWSCWKDQDNWEIEPTKNQGLLLTGGLGGTQHFCVFIVLRGTFAANQSVTLFCDVLIRAFVFYSSIYTCFTDSFVK